MLVKSSFEEVYSRKLARLSDLRSSADVVSLSFPSASKSNLESMDLSASLGNFLFLTVLSRSGMSMLLSFFMWMRNLFCCISL